MKTVKHCPVHFDQSLVDSGLIGTLMQKGARHKVARIMELLWSIGSGQDFDFFFCQFLLDLYHQDQIFMLLQKIGKFGWPPKRKKKNLLIPLIPKFPFATRWKH